MADNISTVWVDATFITEPGYGIEDAYVEFYPAEADNIGDRTVPVIYQTQQANIAAVQDVDVVYLRETSISGSFNLAEEYSAHQPPFSLGVTESLVDFAAHTIISGTPGKDTTHIYSTGWPPASGTMNKAIAFIVGNKVAFFTDVPLSINNVASTATRLVYDVNYSNYSGNTSSSGTPIPFYELDWDIISELTFGNDDYTFGGIDSLIDVVFAGWVDHHLGFDAYSVLHGFNDGFNYEVTITGGGNVAVNYLAAIVSDLEIKDTLLDVYCSLVDFVKLPVEAETIKGRIARSYYEFYSTIEEVAHVSTDVNLFPIKFTNFSLDIGEHTTASGFVSVDVLDDTCPISTDNTYFMVDDVRVPVTLVPIEDGYRMYYDPEDDFSSLEGPTTFTAHAENECGQTLEQDYYLTFGYIVEYDNDKGSWQEIDYGFDRKVAVRVTAENWASCPQTSSLAWDFESKELHNKDLGASITGRFYDFDASDMSAEISPVSTAYFYGKEFRVVLNAKDFAGNKMEPLVLVYRIENKPEN